MKLYELTSTAIVVAGIVSLAYVFFWGTAEQERACTGLCIMCRGIQIECNPDLGITDEVYDEDLIKHLEDEL